MHTLTRTHAPSALGSRARRGMTLLVTVLLSLIAITAAMILIDQVVGDTRQDARRADARVAEHVAQETVTAFRQQLADDPGFYERELFYAERPRVCAPTGEVVAATGPADPAMWPADCGSWWEYVPAGQVVSGYDPHDVLVRAEIHPPTAANPRLTLLVLATVGQEQVGRKVAFTNPNAGGVTLYSDAVLHVGDLSPAPGPTVHGTVYSLRGGTTGDAALTGARVLSECPFTGQIDGVEGVWSAAASEFSFAGCEGAPAERSVRDLTAVPLTVQGAQRSLSSTPACPQAASVLVPGPDGLMSSWMCLRAGATLTALDGTTAQIPADTTAYRLQFHEAIVEVSVANVALTDVDGTSTTYASGSHPLSAPGPVWATVGQFPLPVNGVIATDARTYVGACSLTVGGPDCAPQSPAVPLTVVAGTQNRPADLVISGPVGYGAPLGLVASRSVVLPYWSHAEGSALAVNAHVFAAGIGLTPDTSAVRTVEPTAPNSWQWGSLNVTGSLGAPALGPLPGWASITLTGAPADGLPWFPAFSPYWRMESNVAAGAHQLCGGATCTESW